MHRPLSITAAALTVAMLGGIAEMATAQDNPSAPAVKAHGVFEITLRSDKTFANPFRDAQAKAVFTSPSGKKTEVAGFYYGADQWRVRFVPAEAGEWSYSAVLTAGDGPPLRQKGTFTCRGQGAKGFLRLSRRNPYRMEYGDGTPFYPIGIQTCGYFQVGFDGPAGGGRGGQSSLPADQWCKAFEGAVNLIRWQLGAGTRAGCALALIPENGPIDRYDTDLAAKMDELFALQRAHGFRHILILFQDMSLWGNGATSFGTGRDLKTYKSLKAVNLPDQEAFLRYVVARWGCWVDIWELFNEDSYAPDDYLAHLAKIVRDADPYDHILTTNYARPRADWCEIVTWHEYMGMDAAEVDAYVAGEIAKFKAYGKVVQNTEFGNQGWRSNYDPVKWRIAVWTAFMNESGMLFWGMSGRKTVGRRPYRGNANAYIGPESRQSFRVLNEFTRDMPVDMRPVASGYTEHNDIRTYALSNGAVSALYVHHFSDHGKAYTFPGELFVQTGPGKFQVKWIDPADGKVVREDAVETAHQYLPLKLPPVQIDLTCRIDRVDSR